MAQAIELARKGQFSTTPNPRVGCVLVKNGAILAEGWHERPGGPHAEAMALQKAGELAQGSTAYITLEPCSFVGRTPACSASLVKAGVTSVVCAMQDPHAKVAGSGFAELNAAGIRVKNGLLENQARALNPGYIKREQTGLPRVTLKLAMSLDGRTAMANGESKWITGAEARKDVQRLRAQSCAIITGIGTVLDDNPTLNVRSELLGSKDAPKLELMSGRQPVRVVLDRQCRITAEKNIVQAPGNVIVFADGSALASSSLKDSASLELLPMPAPPAALQGVLEELGRRNMNEVLVEAGPTLAGAFMQYGLVDHLVVYMAPKLMGSTARPLFDLNLRSMADNIELDVQSVRSVGTDLRIDAMPISD